MEATGATVLFLKCSIIFVAVSKAFSFALKSGPSVMMAIGVYGFETKDKINLFV